MMKRLTVLRHAKSSWDNLELDDFDRPINVRGWNGAKRIGRELKNRDFRFDLVLASPAARVRETIIGVREEFDLAAPIHLDQTLYLASNEQLLALIREMPESVERPLFIGHNPGLQELLLNVTKAGEHERSKVQQRFPTAAFAVVELPAHRWSEVEPDSGRFVELLLPDDLD
jgi:phosphohistidine phosphatase